MAFLKKHGLKAQRMIVADYMPELKAFDKLNKEQIALIKEAMKNNAYWKITTIEDFEAGNTASKGKNEKKFDIKAYVKGEKLSVFLTGRVDTLTAPEILSFYEKILGEKRIESVCLDCAELTYISRAGIRVLRVMKENSKISFENVSPKIEKILESEGFTLF